MHNAEAMIASQKGRRKPVEIVKPTFVDPLIDLGSDGVLDPLKGKLKPASD